jgi:hypothetical protein
VHDLTATPVLVAGVGVGSPGGDGWARVSADVDGEPLWFDFDNAVPVACAEGFATAVAGAALAQGRSLRIVAPLGRSWRGRQALEVYRRWYGYPAIEVCAEGAPPGGVAAPRAPATALCFSGGVDSFHNLLRGDPRPDVLILFLGADVTLQETAKLDEMRRRFRLVAEATGTRPVCVRTNFRLHHVTRAASYPLVTHGGMLAAAGHFLRRDIGRLLISASYPRVYPHPWSSHWDVDPFWSDDAIEVVHAGADRWRAAKLAEIVDEPLVREHLRVCFERTKRWNCGRCEKCLRTRIILRKLGALEGMRAFPDARGLLADIESFPAVHDYLVPVYDELTRTADPELAGSLLRLVRRSRRSVRRQGRRRRRRPVRRVAAALLPPWLRRWMKRVVRAPR